MSLWRSFLLCLSMLIAWTSSVSASAMSPHQNEALCSSENIVIYFLPGETRLDSFDEALVDLFAEKSYGCMIDQLEIDAYPGREDGAAGLKDVSAIRATTVLNALSLRGLAASAVKVRIHQLHELNSETTGASDGSRCVVQIKLRPHVGPMS